MLIFLVILLTIITIVLTYIVWNLWRKNVALENAILQFYSRTNLTLKLMRMFDDKKMFESDDEVGEVFSQLSECVEELFTYVAEIRNGGTQEE